MKLANLLLRVRGAGALTDPEVATVLQLTDTQVIRIRDVQRKNQKSLRDRIRELLGRSGRGRQSLRRSLQQLSEESQQRALCLLNEEQRQKLASLQGSEGH